MSSCLGNGKIELSPTGGRSSGTIQRNVGLSITGGTLSFRGVSMQLPYFKFMVQDYLSGTIQACSMETQGLFINLVARIWKAKGKFNTAIADLATLLHVDIGVLERCLAELQKWEIITIDKDGSLHVCFIDEQLEELAQEHNNKVLAGKLGAEIRYKKKSSRAIAVLKQSESDTESESESHTDNKIAWKDSFDEYKKLEYLGYTDCLADATWLEERQKYHSNLNILLSLEKAHKDYWSTESGWKHKKKSRSIDLNWKSTFTNALTLKSNQVWKDRNDKPQRPPIDWDKFGEEIDRKMGRIP